MNTVAVLKLTLHHAVVGYLAGFQSGKNILVFTDSFRFDQQRQTLSLLTSPLYPQADKILEKTYVTHQRLHPLLSNLLPEGEPYRVCRRVNILRDYPDDKIKIYP